MDIYSHLKTNYPFLFRFCSNVSIEAGWFKIVKDLSLSIEHYITENDIRNFSFTSLKRKFGVLEICSKNDDVFISEMIRFAERLSYNTCEKCGKRGYLHSSTGNEFGKLMTLCDKDALKMLYKRIG